MNEISIREGLEKDLEEMYEIEKNTIDSWSFDILKQDLVLNDFSVYFVSEIQNEIVGFISIMNISGEIHINNIVVKKDYRGFGIGEKLLKYGIEYFSEEALLGYTLEVREDNEVAINLYKKLGFKIVGERKNYYKNNKKAYIMWK